MNKAYAILIATIINITCTPALAENDSPREIQQENTEKNEATPIPPSEQLVRLKQIIRENPNNLDNHFKYAQLSAKLGKVEEAKKAYKHMLEANPKLLRVKLELAMLYASTGQFKESKPLFEEVLATNPPKNVEKNIIAVLEKVDEALKTDKITLSVAFGVNRDSNATSAASTGETTFSDVSLPLAQNSLADNDAQIFATTSIAHLHKFDIDSQKWGAMLTTSGTLYKTSQETEHSLDISLASLKIGPTFTLKKLKTQIGINASTSIINLNSFKYIKNRGGEFTIKYAPLNNLIFDYAYGYEYRKFANSPSSLTNVNRTGNAYQHKLGATYAFTKKDIFNTSVTWRNEEARSEQYANDQLSLSSSYTRVLPYGMSVNLLGVFKKTHYNDPDPLISSSKLRNDRERSATITLSKKLPKNVTLTAGYQYKNVTSNIQNYDYFNHRFSSALGWSF